MPFIEVSIAKGRSTDQLRSLMSEIHRVTEETTGALPENISVVVREIDQELWARGDVSVAERPRAAGN